MAGEGLSVSTFTIPAGNDTIMSPVSFTLQLKIYQANPMKIRFIVCIFQEIKIHSNENLSSGFTRKFYISKVKTTTYVDSEVPLK